MVIYLHGGSGADNDNIKQISGPNTRGTHLWTTPENQGGTREAGDRSRTGDLQLGKLTLYQLSYARKAPTE